MIVFFFKQKTAYEMRISDWSSDVCSSDLAPLFGAGTGGFAVPGSAAKAHNEFSRIVTPDRLGAPKLVESFEASPAERAAVARRLELLAVDRLAADMTVTHVGGRLCVVVGLWRLEERRAGRDGVRRG